MTKDEALAVFERKEVPHRYVETGQAKELYPALKDAGDVLAAEVRRLRYALEDKTTCHTERVEELQKGGADLAAARAEAAGLRLNLASMVKYTDEIKAESARLRKMLTVEVLIEAFKQTANGEYVLVEGSDVALDGWWNFDKVLAALEADHDH